MWLFDPETLKFMAVNDAAVVHYGYRRESFLKLTLLDIVPQRDGETAEQLLGNADMALYQAKEDGRRTFCFFQPGMGASRRAHHSLGLDLRKALAAGEFELYYQPLLTLETGVISGFEVLLRWHHPLRGMVASTFRSPRRPA